ncbi:MAG: universal stress protein [Gammaproteobacteria bacterium]|nr:universal stress protein [Gammaproteobacteria bacterium]
MVEKTTKNAILVPVDFSPHSEAALLHAVEIAICLKVHIVALHVVHDPGEMPGYYARMVKKKRLGKLEDFAKEMLDDFLQKVIKDHPKIKELKAVETMLVVGLPIGRILQVVDKIKPRMVVMGSQGLTGLEHLLLGSKAEQLAQLCPIPVTIVKALNKKS